MAKSTKIRIKIVLITILQSIMYNNLMILFYTNKITNKYIYNYIQSFELIFNKSCVVFLLECTF